MALPSSGSISLNQVNVELKKSATAKISMGDSAVRALAQRTSGSISMSHLRGKSSEMRFVNSTNRTQTNIHTLMGSPTTANIYIFENTATISAASAGGWALQTGSFPAGSTLRIINRGAIRGGGGNGGTSGAGGAGGSALVLNFPVSIDNTSGTIWGGGGGGGGSKLTSGTTVQTAGGGGGGGSPAGAGGKGGGDFFGSYLEQIGSDGTEVNGGGGFIVSPVFGGGTGGSVGNAGSTGRSGSGGVKGHAGGRGGYSVQANGNAITWIAVGDRKGSVV